MRTLLRLILDRLWVVLSMLLGLMLAVVLHWLHFIVTGEGSAAVLWLLIAVVLAVLNIRMIPALADLRGRGGMWRRMSGLYMGGAGATTVVGGVVLVSWLGFVIAESFTGAEMRSGDRGAESFAREITAFELASG